MNYRLFYAVRTLNGTYRNQIANATQSKITSWEKIGKIMRHGVSINFSSSSQR